MALPMFRGCQRLPSTFNFARLFLNKRIIPNRSGKTRLPSVLPAAVAAAVRPYSSDSGGQKQSQTMMVLGMVNPFLWFRTRTLFFLIRTYLDKEFSVEEFTEGAKQAFSHVSTLLSQCQFEALEGLVATDMIGKLEEQCNRLPWNYKKAIAADPDDILTTTVVNVGIRYDDDDGRKFVSILMRFWYLTRAHLPEDTWEGIPVFNVSLGGDREVVAKRLLTATYEFQREFTKGVPPDWTITKIEHNKLFD